MTGLPASSSDNKGKDTPLSTTVIVLWDEQDGLPQRTILRSSGGGDGGSITPEAPGLIVEYAITGFPLASRARLGRNTGPDSMVVETLFAVQVALPHRT